MLRGGGVKRGSGDGRDKGHHDLQLATNKYQSYVVNKALLRTYSST